MLKVQYNSNNTSITRYYKASEFPYEAIIKLVQTGVTVTLNSVTNMELVDLSAHNTTFMLDLMSPPDTKLHLSEGC